MDKFLFSIDIILILLCLLPLGPGMLVGDSPHETFCRLPPSTSYGDGNTSNIFMELSFSCKYTHVLLSCMTTTVSFCFLLKFDSLCNRG